MRHDKLKIPPGHLTQEPVPVKWMQRFRYMSRMFDRIAEIDGDVVECGVGEGSTFSMLAYLVGSEKGRARTLRGFDSFEGFPEPDAADESWREPKKGEWAFAQEQVEEHLTQAGVYTEYPGLQVKLVKGFFGDTLLEEPEYPVAFLHADGDLYESYRDILTHFYPRVVSGGVVLFDEYREFTPGKEGEKWPGASKAIDEYFGPLGLVPILDEETGKYFLVKP